MDGGGPYPGAAAAAAGARRRQGPGPGWTSQGVGGRACWPAAHTRTPSAGNSDCAAALFLLQRSRDPPHEGAPHWRPATAFCGVVGAGIRGLAGAPQWPPAMVLLVSQSPSGLQVAQDCLASGHASALLGARHSQEVWPSSFLESLNLTSASFCTSSGIPLPSLPGEMEAQPLGLASGISKRSLLPPSLVTTVGPCPRVLKLSRLKCFQ